MAISPLPLLQRKYQLLLLHQILTVTKQALTVLSGDYVNHIYLRQNSHDQSFTD